MHRLEEEGYTHVAVQSTHVMHGEEYEKMLSQLEPYRMRMKISVGMPLLHSEEDYLSVAKALLNWLPTLDADEALVLMGPGPTLLPTSPMPRWGLMRQATLTRSNLPPVEGIPRLAGGERSLPRAPRTPPRSSPPFIRGRGVMARKQ